MKIHPLSNKFQTFKLNTFEGKKFLIEFKEPKSMLSSIPLINILFNIEIFTYNFNWAFIKKSGFYFRMREKFDTNYYKIKNPLFNFSYWMHSNDLYSCLENHLIKNAV